MEEVGNDAQEAEPAGDDDEFILLSQFLEDILLEFLLLSARASCVRETCIREEEIASPGLSHRRASGMMRVGYRCS